MALTQVQPGMLASDSQYTGFKNRILNGQMVIDQRNAGASVSPANDQYSVDRWNFPISQSSKFTVQQNAGSVTPPVSFGNYLGITSSSAYSITSTDYFLLQQKIEGFNTSDLAWGTANAVTVTLSFWVRSSLTGTFGGALNNNAGNRSYPFSYTISSANTWEQKSITIAGDTSGTWVGATNGIGLQVRFGLGVGSTLSSTANAWGAGQYFAPTGATSVVGTNGATFYITGVQLEKGSTATSFDYRPFGTELVLCQRYFQKVSGSINGSAYQFFAVLTYENASNCFGAIALRTTMRTQPTTTYSGTFSLSYGALGTLINDTNQTGGDVALVGFNSGSGGAAGYSTYFRANNSSATFISFSAEL